METKGSSWLKPFWVASLLTFSLSPLRPEQLPASLEEGQGQQSQKERNPALAPREEPEQDIPFKPEEILKADRKQSLRDTAKLLQLVEALKSELESNDPSVLPVSSVRKAEEIEKLAKKIRSRLKRY